MIQEMDKLFCLNNIQGQAPQPNIVFIFNLIYKYKCTFTI
jgi:hypothetical protein